MNRRLILASLLVVALLLTACGTDAKEAHEGLTIDVSALSGEPSFIDWTQSGTPMQLIALKGADGSARLVFNTCQSCKGSPWAWFEDLGGGLLQCQNCMQIFSTDIVGTEEAQGCNPISILSFTEADGKIVVPESALAEAEPWFRNWKRTGE